MALQEIKRNASSLCLAWLIRTTATYGALDVRVKARQALEPSRVCRFGAQPLTAV